MRILAVGDPHGDLIKIKNIPFKDSDVVLLTGDLGKADLARERFFENIKRRKEGLEPLEEDAKHSQKTYMEVYDSSLKILRHCTKFSPTYSILGNVGMSMIKNSWVKKEERKWDINLPSFRDSMNNLDNFYFVRNRVRNIGGLRVGFLEYFVDNCWIKEFGEKRPKSIKSAKKETENAKRFLKNFGALDILVCHQPPYGYLDKVGAPAPKHWRGKHAGSKVILNYIKKHKPKYVFCGHIHEGEGSAKIGETEIYNLGVCGYKKIDL